MRGLGPPQSASCGFRMVHGYSRALAVRKGFGLASGELDPLGRSCSTLHTTADTSSSGRFPAAWLEHCRPDWSRGLGQRGIYQWGTLVFGFL